MSAALDVTSHGGSASPSRRATAVAGGRGANGRRHGPRRTTSTPGTATTAAQMSLTESCCAATTTCSCTTTAGASGDEPRVPTNRPATATRRSLRPPMHSMRMPGRRRSTCRAAASPCAEPCGQHWFEQGEPVLDPGQAILREAQCDATVTPRTRNALPPPAPGTPSRRGHPRAPSRGPPCDPLADPCRRRALSRSAGARATPRSGPGAAPRTR